MKWINDRKLWALALIAFTTSLSSNGQSFTEVAAARNAQIGTGSKDGGQAWADLNQDGFLDLIVNTNNATGRSRLLFWNSGTNQYDDVTAANAPSLLLNTCERSALAGDFDNDGDIDFMRSTFTRLEIYENLGPLAPTPYSFTIKQIIVPATFTVPGTQAGMNNEGLAWMDFDGDGDLDVYMEDHQYGQDILENDGTGFFTHYTPDSDSKGFPTTGISGDYSVTADLDDNGDVDIVARREGITAALDEVDIFTNNSDGTFGPNNSFNLDTRNGFKGGVAVADFDNDGDFDYFWTNHGTSSANVTHVIAEQTGLNSGVFALATVTIAPAPTWTGQEIEGIAMGDVNNDGKVDVFLASDSGAGYLLMNTTTGGTFSFNHSNSGINLSGDGEGCVFGDYDNDGDLDLYVNIRNGNNQLWENDLGGNADYLKVEPLIDLGGGLTRSAIGATVVMELQGCTNLKFIQEVSGGVGHGSQNDNRLHFGLPTGANQQYKLTVSFVRPNGGARTIVEKYVTPSALANQTLQVLDTDTSDPNAHPVPADDNFKVPMNSTNNPLDVLTNDTDPNGEDLTISLLSGTTAQGGTVSVNDNGTPADPTDDFIDYTPVNGFSGVDNFTYHVTNQSGFCSSASVTITVNTPPTGDNNSVSTQEDVTYAFTSADFTVNYSDANGDAFAEIRITNLESVGSLLYNGTPVTLNQVIDATDIASGLLTFVPVADQFGSPYDSFDFEVGDGLNFSPSDYTLTINVTPVNDPPTGDNNSVSTQEDITYVFAAADFSVNYSDPESDPFAEIRVTSLESVGNLLYSGAPVTLNQVITAADIGSGLLTFVPVANQSGSPYDSFDFEVGDGSDFSAADYTLTINVTPVNDPPTGDNNSVSTQEDITYVFAAADFTVNYNDPEGDAFARIRITSLESVGSLLFNGNPVTLNQVINAADIGSGLLTFVPVAGQSGSPYDSFDFEVGDGTDFSTSDYTLIINVTPVNDPPTADNNTVSTPEDITYVFAVADFTVNYNDTEGDAFAQIRVTSLESVGSLELSGTPVILNQVITAADIGSGLLTFVPVANQSGSPYDSFDFEVGDGTDFSTSDYTLTINVTPVNDPPTADNNTVSTQEDITYVFAVADFTVNYNDTEGDAFAQIRVTSLESVGSLELSGTPVILNQVITAGDIGSGLLTFVPVANQSGSPYDSFDFEVGDGTDFSTSDYTLIINVTPVNDPPTADNNTVSTQEDITYVFAVADFTVNYNDTEGDAFAQIRVTSLESVGNLLYNGTPVTLNQIITAGDIGSGLLTFVPVAGQNGSPYDSFDFEVGDGNDFSTVDYTMTINVGPVNDPPTSNSLTITIDEDVTHVFGTVQFTSGYSDPEGDAFASIRVTQLPVVGTLLYNGTPVAINQIISATDIINGLVTFASLPGESGSPYDSFDFEVGDGTNFSVTAYTLTINVSPVNDSPVAVDDNVTTAEETSLAVDVYPNDNLGDTPTFISSVDGTTIQGGTAVINNNGTPADTSDDFIDYLPPTGFNGTDTFTYTIEDVDGESSTATVIVTVTPVNDSPLAVDDAGTTAEDASTTIDVLINDDLGDTPTSISSVDATTSQGGAAVINNNGTPGDPTDDFIDYTPATDFNGNDTFTYTIQDNDGETSTATVTVTVTGINDTPLAVDDNTSAIQDIMETIDVMANDNLGDLPTTIITVDAITTEGGTAVINNNGTPADTSDDFIDYTPANGFIGTDTFTYTIEDFDGERSTATVTVVISLSPNTLVIYKGFSPNGDGSNDEWVIDGILLYPNNTIQVFNRWGNMVYKEKGYDNQSKVWFGQSNEGWIIGENQLPDGTYFYMVDLGDGSNARSGYVMLKR